jgi:hypothetical protein
MGKNIRIQDLDKELGKMLDEFKSYNFEQRQGALKAGMEVLKTSLEQAAPRDTGELAKSFEVVTYPDKQFIGSNRTVDGKGKDGRVRQGIPLINILEYREGGTPFVRNTYEAKEQQIYEAIKNKLKNGGN